jgi:hypothetical protein
MLFVMNLSTQEICLLNTRTSEQNELTRLMRLAHPGKRFGNSVSENNASTRNSCLCDLLGSSPSALKSSPNPSQLSATGHSLPSRYRTSQQSSEWALFGPTFPFRLLSSLVHPEQVRQDQYTPANSGSTTSPDARAILPSNEANTHTAGKGYMNGISRFTITLQMSIDEVMSER